MEHQDSCVFVSIALVISQVGATLLEFSVSARTTSPLLLGFLKVLA